LKSCDDMNCDMNIVQSILDGRDIEKSLVEGWKPSDFVKILKKYKWKYYTGGIGYGVEEYTYMKTDVRGKKWFVVISTDDKDENISVIFGNSDSESVMSGPRDLEKTLKGFE